MKRILSVVLLSVLIWVQMPIYAAEMQDAVQFQIIGTTLRGSGTILPEQDIAILLTNGGKTAGEADKVLAMYEGNADADGNIVVALSFSEERAEGSTTLTAFVRYGANDLQTYDFRYMTKPEKEDFVERVLKPVASAEQMADVLTDSKNQESLRLIGLDVDLLMKMNSQAQANAAKLLYQSGVCREGDVERIAETFDEALKINLIGAGVADTAEILDQYKDFYNLHLDSVTWDTVKEDRELAAWVVSILEENAPFESVDAINTSFGEGYALYQLNHVSSYGQTETVLANYAQVFGIQDSDDYSTFTNSKYTTAAAKELYRLLYQQPAASKADVQAYLHTAVQEARNAEAGGGSGNRPGSGGGSSGGGWSGGGGGSTITAPPSTGANPIEDADEASGVQLFTDLPAEHYAYQAVSSLYAQKVIDGYEDGSFRPDGPVSREEFLKMLIGALQITPVGGTTPFSDVAYGKWYSPYVTTAWAKGLVNGLSETEFGIGRQITREDMAVMIRRTAKELRIELPKVREYKEFGDQGSISAYASKAVQEVYEAGLMSGDGENFYPRDAANRGESAVLLFRFMELNK